MGLGVFLVQLVLPIPQVLVSSAGIRLHAVVFGCLYIIALLHSSIFHSVCRVPLIALKP